MFESLPQDHSAALAGSCIVLSIGKGQAVDLKAEAEEAKRLLQLALSIDEKDADTLALGGHITAWSGDFDTAIEMVDRSIALNPNSALLGGCEAGPTNMWAMPRRQSGV
jgi:tetratricopeptide (TPR) repeat protein